MKVAIVSDTHGARLEQVVEIILEHQVDDIFFLGDMYADGEFIKYHTGLPLREVEGNNEFFSHGQAPAENFFELGKHKILLTHGHIHGIYRGREELAKHAKSLGADLCFYGHSHIFSDELIDGVWLINPGSASRPRKGEASMLIGDFSGDFSYEKIFVPPNYK